jgi:hypothetical protein
MEIIGLFEPEETLRLSVASEMEYKKKRTAPNCSVFSYCFYPSL